MHSRAVLDSGLLYSTVINKGKPEGQGPLDHTMKDMSAETGGPLYNTAPVPSQTDVHGSIQGSKSFCNPTGLNVKTETKLTN